MDTPYSVAALSVRTDGKERDSRERGDVTGILNQVMLAQAMELARAGSYEAAEALIEPLRRDEFTGRIATDLLARIRAQQKRFAEAHALWAELCQVDPQNESYKGALKQADGRLAKQRHSRRWRLPFRAGFRVTDLDISAPDVVQKRNGAGVEVVFRTPLFEEGEGDIRDEVKPVLCRVGRQLEPHVGKIAIVLTGHTNDKLRPSGQEGPENAELGMMRAMAVFRYLTRTTKLQGSMFSLQSAGEFDAPFANDTEENRARNEAVTLRVRGL